MFKSIFIQQDRKRSLIDQRHFHFRSENAGLYYRDRLPQFFNHIFIEFLRHLRIPCLHKTGPVSFSAVCVQSKLRNQQDFPFYICQRKVCLSFTVFKYPEIYHFFDILICSLPGIFLAHSNKDQKSFSNLSPLTPLPYQTEHTKLNSLSNRVEKNVFFGKNNRFLSSFAIPNFLSITYFLFPSGRAGIFSMVEITVDNHPSIHNTFMISTVPYQPKQFL